MRIMLIFFANILPTNKYITKEERNLQKMHKIFLLSLLIVCTSKHNQHSADASLAGIVQYFDRVVTLKDGHMLEEYKKRIMAFADRMKTLESSCFPNCIKEGWTAKFGNGEMSQQEFSRKLDLLNHGYTMMEPEESKIQLVKGQNGQRFGLVFTGKQNVLDKFKMAAERYKPDSPEAMIGMLNRAYEEGMTEIGAQVVPKEFLATDFRDNIFGFEVGRKRTGAGDVGYRIHRKEGNLHTAGWNAGIFKQRLAHTYDQPTGMARRNRDELSEDFSRAFSDHSKLFFEPNSVSASWEGYIHTPEALGQQEYRMRHEMVGKREESSFWKVGKNHPEEFEKYPGNFNNFRITYDIANDLIKEGDLLNYDPVTNTFLIPARVAGSSGNTPHFQGNLRPILGIPPSTGNMRPILGIPPPSGRPILGIPPPDGRPILGIQSPQGNLPQIPENWQPRGNMRPILGISPPRGRPILGIPPPQGTLRPILGIPQELPGTSSMSLLASPLTSKTGKRKSQTTLTRQAVKKPRRRVGLATTSAGDYSIDIAGRGPRPPPVPSRLASRKFKWNRTPSGKWSKTD